MNYPFEFSELLLTEDLVRYMGFNNWWGDSGDGYDIAYGEESDNLSPTRYRLKSTREEQEPYSYSHPVYETAHIMSDDFKTLYFFHEMYEDMREKLIEDEFKELLDLIKKKGRSVKHYIDSYEKWKAKQ